jgi:uncharacterized protein
MRNLLVLAFACLLLTNGYAQYTVESIPNRKLIDNSYVSNPDHILDENTVASIDLILKSLEEKTSVQVAVVAVNSIGEIDIFDFAQELFTTWGIGNKNNDNGLLLLLVKDKRTIRFHTGDGIEGTLPDAVCKGIQRDYMVPQFKEGDYSAGMLAGIEELERILINPAYSEELKTETNEISDYAAFVFFIGFFLGPIFLILFFTKSSNGKFSNSKKNEFTLYPEMRMKRWHWALLFGGIPVVILVLFWLGPEKEAGGQAFLTIYAYYWLTLFYKLTRMQKVIRRFKREGDYYQIVQFIRSNQWYWFFMAILFPLPFAGYFIYHLFRKKIYRNHSRQCQLCSGEMRKLNEKDDDTFLSKAMQMEETLRAVDYDVWQCKSCLATEEWSYPNRFSKYKECPTCKTFAYYLVGRNTKVSATYSSEGSGEETNTCKFCSKTKVSHYSIPRLVRSTSSSSSGSSFSSSSGGSWGGGSSGGGGASSSW